MYRISVQHVGVPHDEPRDRIAAEVRAEMARQRKLQSELGQVLGLPQQAVSVRLLGRRSFRAEEIALIARWLEVPAERFLALATPERAA